MNRLRVAVTGFSLIEIVVALGIVSFAVVGIMGLIPVAMKSALESQRETRATLIAQQIFSDLVAASGTNAFLAIGTNISDVTSRLSVNLAASNVFQVGYGPDGLPVGQGNTNGAVYVADVSLSPNQPVTGVTKIQTVISTPAAAAQSLRSQYVFVSLARTN